MFSVWLVCLFVDYAKINWPIFTELGEGVEHGPRKNPFNFGADSEVFHFL